MWRYHSKVRHQDDARVFDPCEGTPPIGVGVEDFFMLTTMLCARDNLHSLAALRPRSRLADVLLADGRNRVECIISPMFECDIGNINLKAQLSTRVAWIASNSLWTLRLLSPGRSSTNPPQGIHD